ncbi:hypothetical protein KIPB_013062, partial [Kipferlia bialata]|eukprot:g13062.t1
MIEGECSEYRVKHKCKRRAAIVYVGPLGADGVTPAETLKDGETRSILIIGQNDLNPSHLCVMATQNAETGEYESRPILGCPLAEKIGYLSATRVGGEVYTFGGLSDGKRQQGLHCFNIETQQWREVEQRGDWPQRRSSHASFALSGKLYILGGQGRVHTDGVAKECWRFDPSSEQWTKVQNCCVSVANPYLSMVVAGTAHVFCDGTHVSYNETQGFRKENPVDIP